MVKLAKFLSLILGPVILWPVTLTIILFNTHLHYQQLIIFLPALFLLQAVIPFGYILLAFKGKKISDLDLTKRRERYRPIFVVAACLLMSLVVIYFFGNRELFSLSALLFLLIFLNGIITVFWKISFHMAINTVFVILINYFYHWSFVYLLVFLPLIFWSRLTLKKHTVNQLLGALVLNGAVIILFLKYVIGL